MNKTNRTIFKLTLYGLTLTLFNCTNTGDKKQETPVANSVTKTVPQKITMDFIDLFYAEQTLSDLVKSAPADINKKDSIWSDLLFADKLIKENKKEDAIILLQKLISRNIDSRTKLIAWNSLREMGVKPTKPEVLGLVLEVPIAKDSIDILAMYLDKTARYADHSMRGAIWELHEPEMDKLIESAVSYSKDYSLNLSKDGKLGGGRNKIKTDNIRLYFLTTSGLFYTEKTWRDTESTQTPFGYIFAVSTKVFSKIVKKCAENLGVTKQ